MRKSFFHHFSLSAISCTCAAILLSACGGGSGEGAAPGTYSAADSTTSVQQPTSTNSTSQSSTPSPDPASSSTTTTPTSSTSSTSSTATAASGPYGQDASLYTLAFSDEFENGYNSNVWNDTVWYESPNATKNYTVENGALKIWPQVDASGNFFNRTIDTDGKYYQTYGYFEIEAKLPYGKGTWPAFWLLNHDDATLRPEIDILEAYAGGGPNSGWSDANLHPTAYASTIWPVGIQSGPSAGTKTFANLVDLSAGFHKYGLKWEPGKQTFYFDGQPMYSVNVSMSSRMYILLDLWFGSASGTPDSTTPQGKSNSFEINYVRAWKFK